MRQVQKPSLMRSMFPFKRLLLLAGIGFLSSITLGSSQTTVSALETRSQGATWQGASFPVENFQGYTSPFGYRQSPDGSYNQEFHRGLDMAAPEGSYVRSWWTGKVVEISDNSACGTSVVIQSGDWMHIYCHMQGRVESDGKGGRYISDRVGGLQVWEHQTVTAGARIGRVGMTGRTTGPHLHWGLKYTGQWVDPALVLRAMYAEQGSQSVSSRPQ
jgi:murein DD-endopeptidase MepM/ murein hydrolase activator NlpD